MLRQRALASMRVAKDQQLDSMNKMMPNSSSNTSVPSIRESLATLRPMNLSGENRSSKARKTDYTSTPSQQQQQNQQPDQGTRDPRLLRLIEPSVITNYLASPSGIGRSTEHLPRQREATQQFQNNVRSFPSTDTARSRNVSLERSNGFPTSSSINRSVPVKRKIQEEEKEEDTDQFFDALDHWVGKYREDMEYAEGQDPDTKVDPSATLSWISGII
ncbi:hypothetical protein BDA99DRAFT_4322 [Phascolomyces articulosus]|uniref:Uncharacterized protein n=1 Tax=Phascolomyces articulosus TaxID=60185 RepID=A0AAD5PM38_9FUNG|nr:hypothetical protein BDA99DRAFT_4322 [Phascolomyces articulosus]